VPVAQLLVGVVEECGELLGGVHDAEVVCAQVCCSVLQCVAVCCLQCVAVCCSVLQCVAVCCSVLQCQNGKSSWEVCPMRQLSVRSVLQCVAVCWGCVAV